MDLDECIERLYKKELLAESVVEAICAKTKELLMKESNVVHIAAPVTVVGDIHGQFFDMIEIFRIGGWCPDTNYLFLGENTPSESVRLNAVDANGRGLCRPRPFQRRDNFLACMPEVEIPKSCPFDSRQP